MKNILIRLTMAIILAVLCAPFLTAMAATGSREPPTIPDMSNVPDTLKSSPISEISLGNLIVELEKTTFSDVQKSVKVGTVQYNGKDAGGSESWLCYTVPSHRNPEHIWFSSGEIGGNESILSFYVEVADKEKITFEGCPALPKRFLPVSFSGKKLWIGSSSEQLKVLFGEPSQKKGKWWIYSHAKKIIANCNSCDEKKPIPYDLSALLAVEVDNGTIIALYESEVTAS